MPQITTAFAPDFVTTMRWALDAASDRVPATSRTPATKAKMAQSIVRSAHEGITDAHQLVAGRWPKAWCLRSSSEGPRASERVVIPGPFGARDTRQIQRGRIAHKKS